MGARGQRLFHKGLSRTEKKSKGDEEAAERIKGEKFFRAEFLKKSVGVKRAVLWKRNPEARIYRRPGTKRRTQEHTTERDQKRGRGSVEPMTKGAKLEKKRGNRHTREKDGNERGE